MRRHAPDLAIAAGLMLLAAFVSYRLGADLPRSAYQLGSDVWFEGDPGRVVLAMTVGQGGDATHRSDVHPLFILLTNPPVYVLRGLGLEQLQAARVAIAGITGIWLATLYGVLRLVGLHRPDAALFALVGGTSGAAAFWLTVPETYGLGSITIMLALGLAAMSRYRSIPEWASVTASAGSLSVTTTNWIAGLAATSVSHPLCRAIAVTVKALAVVVLAWGLQKALYPDVDFFIGNVEEGSQQFFSKRAGGPGQVLKVGFLFSEVVPMPDIRKSSQLSVQKTPLTSYRFIGAVAAAGWGVLLLLGAWALIAAPVAREFRIALAVTLAVQTAVVLVYGTETFLYTVNFITLLVLVTGLTATTGLRPLTLAIALVLAVCGAINNYGLRAESVNRAKRLAPEPGTTPFEPTGGRTSPPGRLEHPH